VSRNFTGGTWNAGGTGRFDVIAGKSIPEEDAAKIFALARGVDRTTKRRLRNTYSNPEVSCLANRSHFYPTAGGYNPILDGALIGPAPISRPLGESACLVLEYL
jgi:hypothetical protein